MSRRLTFACLALACSCVGTVSALPESPSPAMIIEPAHLDGGTAQVEPFDAGTTEADAGAPPDAGAVQVDAGFTPGLPPACQGLVNHTHGTCADAYAAPDYGSVVWDFRGDVEQAIAAVGQPADLFDGDVVLAARRADYAALVAAQLDTAGLCAVWNGAELYVRDRSRDSNETFSLFTSSGRPRAGGHYQCARSDELPGTRPAFSCALTPSSNASCGNPGQNLFTEVVSLVEEVIQEEQPKGASSAIIDFDFKSLHVRGWRLKDDGYPFVEAVARKANARGYCVQSNGWKSIDLKQLNALSEKYSLVTHVDLPDPVTKPALSAACLSDGILPSCEFIIEKGEETCRPASF